MIIEEVAMQPTPAFEYERRRATARRLLSVEPNNPRRLMALRNLLAPEHVQVAAQEGVLIVGHHASEHHLQQLAHHLRSLGLRVWVEMTGAHTHFSTNIVRAGVVILVLCRFSLTDVDLQHCYAIAMTLGKVVLPIASHESPLPQLFFDFEPLYWGSDNDALLTDLTQLLRPSLV